MAGVTGSGGMEISKKSVPTIGGSAEVVSSDHFAGPRAEGVAYDSNESIGVNRTTSGYPQGTDFGEASNPLKP